jgi:hypothetical protein
VPLDFVSFVGYICSWAQSDQRNLGSNFIILLILVPFTAAYAFICLPHDPPEPARGGI